ncbi:hypothetical protein ACQ4PT_019786 [Festuca glaucescens]
MEAGGGAGGVEDEKNHEVLVVAAAEEVVGGEGGGGETTMSAGALRSTVVGAAVIGSVVISPVVEVPADLAAVDSATVGGEGDAGPSTIASVAVGAAVIGEADLAQGSSAVAQGSSALAYSAVEDLDVKQASGEVSMVKPDMQKEEAGEGSRKRKLAEVALDQEVVEPVEPPYQEVEESNGSLEIEDNIIEQYRREYGKKSDANQKSAADMKKVATGRINGKPRSSKKPAPSWEMMMEINMKRMLQESKTEIMQELLERCAKVSEEAHHDADYVTHARTNGDNFVGDGTPENPWHLRRAM